MTAEEIYNRHIDEYLKENRMCNFDDIPNEIFIEAMKQYAEQEREKAFKAGYSSCQDDYTNDFKNGITLEEYKQLNPLT